MISDSVHLKAFAKVNLALDILGRDDKSGYHFVDTVVYRLPDLFDEIVLEPNDSLELVCDDADVCCDERNTIWKAMKLLGEENWKVTLHKRIPMRSGLGGGSSDAAAVITYFGELRGLHPNKMMEIARKIGMDVPLFLADGNVVHCTRYGDVVVNAYDYGDLSIDVFASGFRVATEEAYSSLDLDSCGLNADMTFQLLAALREGNSIESFIHNDFELGFFHKNPSLKEIGFLCGSGGWMWRFKT